MVSIQSPSRPERDREREMDTLRTVVDPDLSLCDSQVRNDADSSLALPSEPPDIGNWFSSYVYESSTELSNVDGLEDSNIINGDNNRINKMTPAESGSFGEHTHEMRNINELPGSSESLEFHSEPPDIGKWFSSYGYESPELNSDDDGFHYSVFTGTENEQNDTEKHKEFSSINGSETVQSCPVNVKPEEGTNTAISSIMLGCEVDDSLEPVCKIKSQKLIEEDEDSDGFIPIKRRRGEENCVINLKSGLNQETKPMNKKGRKEEIIIRKPLAEMTNQDHLEFAGKWQCPRKNKQVLGPILKQRRLDRWFHRL